MTIFCIERLSPIEPQKHCISNSLKYNASLHFVYRHVDIITLLSCTLSGSDCIYQKRSQQFIHALLTSYTTHFIYFATSQTSFPPLNAVFIQPLLFLNMLKKFRNKQGFQALFYPLNVCLVMPFLCQHIPTQ